MTWPERERGEDKVKGIYRETEEKMITIAAPIDTHPQYQKLWFCHANLGKHICLKIYIIHRQKI